MANPEDLLLATFQLDMSASQCGYPLCCPGKQPKFVDVEFFPTSIRDMGLEQDLREFMEETEEIYHDTGMPMFPCTLHHFCLPFSPICALLYCMSKRKSKLEDIVKEFNKEKATSKGIYVKWNDDYYASYESRSQPRRRRRPEVILVPVLKPGLDVKMNVPKRQEFCAKNGIPFIPPIIQGQPNTGMPMTHQPPYNPGMGVQTPYNAAMPPPPPYAPQAGGGGFYPPPPQPGVQTQPYILPPQHEQPKQYVVQGPTGLGNTGLGNHYQKHDSHSIKSNSSSSDDEK